MSLESTNRKRRIMVMLLDNPRKSLSDISRETGWPVSTIYETVKRILEVYELKAFFVQKCPNCQGENAKTGFVEAWDDKCPECGKEVPQ